VVDLSLAAACCRWRSATTAAAWPPDLAKARSFGIRGLHERASTVGGWVDLSSSGAAAPR
jgi:hypothetical protein